MAARGSTGTGLSDWEREALRDRVAEGRSTARLKGAEKAAAERREVDERIAALPDEDRALAERVHAIVTATAPELAPRLWYGMPAYARDGKVVLFFQGAHKFKSRYSTLGFSDAARLDDGAMWPTSYALTTIGEAEERAIAELVRRAAG